MTTKDANNRICSYYSLLKKTGEESMCTVQKLVLLPLLVDMTEGCLSVFKDTDSSYLVDRFIQKVY